MHLRSFLLSRTHRLYQLYLGLPVPNPPPLLLDCLHSAPRLRTSGANPAQQVPNPPPLADPTATCVPIPPPAALPSPDFQPLLTAFPIKHQPASSRVHHLLRAARPISSQDRVTSHSAIRLSVPIPPLFSPPGSALWSRIHHFLLHSPTDPSGPGRHHPTGPASTPFPPVPVGLRASGQAAPTPGSGLSATSRMTPPPHHLCATQAE